MGGDSTDNVCHARILRAQVLLHDVEPNRGMINFLKPTATGRYSMGIEGNQIPDDQVVVPPALRAGSVILYHPVVMHRGGENLTPDHKVVLDVMLQGGETYAGDDTAERYREQ